MPWLTDSVIDLLSVPINTFLFLCTGAQSELGCFGCTIWDLLLDFFGFNIQTVQITARIYLDYHFFPPNLPTLLVKQPGMLPGSRSEHRCLADPFRFASNAGLGHCVQLKGYWWCSLARSQFCRFKDLHVLNLWSANQILDVYIVFVYKTKQEKQASDAVGWISSWQKNWPML